MTCTALRRPPYLDGCTFSLPVGGRLLVVAQPARAGSTLLRVLAGLSRPRGGSVSIAGLSDPSTEGWGRRVAYVGPEPGIHPWMTPREALALAADLLQLTADEAAARIERAIAWCRFPSGTLDRPVRRGGPPLLERTGYASALIGDPEVLLLDEPLRALDPAERARLLLLPGRRRTILLSSHYPSSEAGLVTHVALLRAGRVALFAPLAELANAGLPLSVDGITTLAERRMTSGDAGSAAAS